MSITSSSEIADVPINKQVRRKKAYEQEPDDEYYGSRLDSDQSLFRLYVKPELLSSFQQTKTAMVMVVHPASHQLAYISCFNEKDFKLTDVNGHVLKSEKLNFSTLSLTLTRAGSLYMTNPNEKCVMEIQVGSQNGGVERFSTAPLIPICVCATQDGNLLLSLCDETGYAVSEQSTRILRKCTTSGLQITTVERDSSGARLFNRPGRVRVNKKNGHIVVGNRTGTTSATLVVFDSNLQLLFRYVGSGRTLLPGKDISLSPGTRDFFPVDVDFDSMNNLVVADFQSRVIDLLSSEGRLIRTLIRDNDVPRSLMFHSDDDTLWVGYVNGKVKIYKYIETVDLI